MIKQNTRCLACDGEQVHLALNLGSSPLANSYKDTEDPVDERYPLAVNLCYDCYHLQLSHTVDPGIIYKNYMYATGTNNTIHRYCEWFANFVKEYKSSNTVLDIGCNDGTQLDYFADLGYKTYGIDPAENLHERINKKHEAICDFFGPDAVAKLAGNRYDVIVAQNVFAHNPDPIDFLKSCKKLLGYHSLLFIQTSQADMVLHNEFDTIYHEHINFFNVNSMNVLAKLTGMYLVDVVKTPIHGNSYVFVLSLKNLRPYNVQNIIDMERASGLYKPETYNQWRTNVQNNMRKLVETVEHYRSEDYRIIGYGAAAKGMTLINYSGIDIDFIVDDNPLKQGKFAPGTIVPICSPTDILKVPDHENILFIPLAWNFFDEIKERIESIRRVNGDKFLRYFPEVSVQ